MQQTHGIGNETVIFFGLVFLLFIIILVLWFNSIEPFLRERAYIKMEINRCYDDAQEYSYWKKQLKRLYLRSIPIIGRFFR